MGVWTDLLLLGLLLSPLIKMMVPPASVPRFCVPIHNAGSSNSPVAVLYAHYCFGRLHATGPAHQGLNGSLVALGNILDINNNSFIIEFNSTCFFIIVFYLFDLPICDNGIFEFPTIILLVFICPFMSSNICSVELNVLIFAVYISMTIISLVIPPFINI